MLKLLTASIHIQKEFAQNCRLNKSVQKSKIKKIIKPKTPKQHKTGAVLARIYHRKET